MAKQEQPIDVGRSTLGGALSKSFLRIPNYQREYSWKPARVRKLFADLSNAMVKGQSSYFLGTLVFTPGDPPCVVDGQQRLATTSIFLAAVRDAFLELEEFDDAKSIRNDYLFKRDRERREDVPRLHMNIDDRAYMKDRVLEPTENPPEARLHSHRLIDKAAEIAALRVRTIMAGADTKPRKVDALNAWVAYIEKNAVVVTLGLPNAARAFQVYKTMNDRAQRTTQGDMIKNHLFEQAEDHVDEAQAKWSSMRSTIENLDSPHKDDPLLEYLHHVSIVLNGPTIKDEIFEVMEEEISGRSKSLAFLDSLANLSNNYAAIVTPSHPKWGPYDTRVRGYVKSISQDLRLSFIRPLMLAVATKFNSKETHHTYGAFVAWVVRFLICGGHRSGATEKAFGDAAKAINKGEITTTAELALKLKHVIPNDHKFRAHFRTKSLKQGKAGRFFLHELESQKRGGSAEAMEQPVQDTSEITLEHVCPKNLEAKEGWQHFSAEERRAYCFRLGNMLLMKSKDNGACGDKPFKAKRPFYITSEHIRLTADVIQRTNEESLWTRDDIIARQEMMADLAVARWPVIPKGIKFKRKR